jgi:hypothetical protein
MSNKYTKSFPKLCLCLVDFTRRSLIHILVALNASLFYILFLSKKPRCQQTFFLSPSTGWWVRSSKRIQKHWIKHVDLCWGVTCYNSSSSSPPSRFRFTPRCPSSSSDISSSSSSISLGLNSPSSSSSSSYTNIILIFIFNVFPYYLKSPKETNNKKG